MTPDAFLEAVRDDRETALSRLGSSKALYAATGGELEPERVRATTLAAHRAVAAVLEGWADGDGDAAGDAADDDGGRADATAVWAAAAAHERETVDLLDGADGAGADPDDPPAAAAALADRATTVERAGALVGWTLARGATTGQATGFFVGQADPTTADTYRTIGDRIEAQRERALELLAAECGEDGAAWDRAAAAAADAVGAAYDEYVERLEAMGVNPKPVC